MASRPPLSPPLITNLLPLPEPYEFLRLSPFQKKKGKGLIIIIIIIIITTPPAQRQEGEELITSPTITTITITTPTLPLRGKPPISQRL